FLVARETVASFISAERYKKVIIIGADKMSSIIDYTDRTTCVIFGDGAGAVLLEPSEEENVVRDAILHSDGVGEKYLKQKAGGSRYPANAETVLAREHFVQQEGGPVFKAAVKGMSDVVTRIMERNNLSKDDVNWLVPHQANRRIIETVSRLADFPMDKVMVNIHKFGNTTAGTLPLCLWDYEDQLNKGDDIILTAFGGGFTWGAVYLKWAI
ncbi:MAG: 3-oxoacyl-ACP synthase, partial [Bacteroidetes bacterium]